jgi:predicted outer membrane protein|tara:strand:+ start:198 stop:470 length:273 start_codon:yes stop_codon:yes gene_type:complete
MKLKETLMIAVAALAFMLITGIAKSDEKTITPQEFVSNVAEVPGKVGNWFTSEVEKTKEYQKKSWAKTKDDFASLVKKFGLLGEKDDSQN